MWRTVVLSLCSMLCLTVGQLTSLDERPWSYDDSLVANFVDPTSRQGISYRLPNDTFPHRYDIALTTRIDLGVLEFTGSVQILLEAKTATSVITVHSKQLTIGQITLRNAETQAIIGTSFRPDTLLEFLEISTTTPLVVGQKYILDISYNGNLRNDFMGFYRTSYINEMGMTKWLAATQFQPTEARHAFPCYDEPGIRSIFGLTMTHGRTYHAISNMPVKEIIDDGTETITTVYEDSPVIPSHLLAFLVSELDTISNAATKLPSDLLQQVVGRSSYLSTGQADFALEAGIKTLKSFENHFGQKYPLPKIDQSGVPGFGSSMAHGGLVTYRESLLYYRIGQALVIKETAAGIVAHEYAHQWFGNMVSPTWWEFNWLNEGFATLYGFIGAELSYPEFRFNDLMVVRVLQSVFELDAYESTRPMNTYSESPAEIRASFDFVASDKSGCVLRMIQHALTDGTFTKGLNYFFNEMQYKAADPYDLYRNLEKAAREDNAVLPADNRFNDILDSWTYQKGYPAIHVSRNADGVITVKQERFLLEKQPGSQPQTWYIPFNFAVASSADFSRTTPDGWIPRNTESITLPRTPTEEWVLFNKQQTGYYRVNYDETLWELLANELNDGDFKKIHVLNRGQLIDDAFNFARVNQAKYSTTLRLMEYLSKELDYVPWVAAVRALTSLDKMLSGSDQYANFQNFALQIVQPLFERFGVRIKDDDNYLDRHARNIGVRWSCYLGFQPCREGANGRVQEFIVDNIMSRGMCNGLRHAEEAEFLTVWNKQQASTSASDRALIISALGCVEDRNVLKLYLESTITNTGVNYMDNERVSVLTAVINGGIGGVEAVLEFLEEHNAAASAYYKLSAPVNNMATWISTSQHIDAFTKLVDRLIADGNLSAAEAVTARTTVQNNMEWMETHLPDIKVYLEDFVSRSNSSGLIISGSLVVFSVIISIVNHVFG